MNLSINKLNSNQTIGLANLCFDLAKAAFVIVFFPTANIFGDFITTLLKMLTGLVIGLAFTYLALLILESKEKE